MGHKIHPYGFRVGITKNWLARWFGGKNYADYLWEDIRIREHIHKRFQRVGIKFIIITRIPGFIKVDIHTARPGVIIGRGGQDIEFLRDELEKISGKKIQVNVQPIEDPLAEAQIVSESIAIQMEKKLPFRRVCKRTIMQVMKQERSKRVKGVKIMVSGRLDGGEIARTEWFKEGRLPLQTLKADIDYGFSQAYTKYGVIGVKVWIFKEEEEAKSVISQEGEIPKTAEGKDEGAGAERK